MGGILTFSASLRFATVAAVAVLAAFLLAAGPARADTAPVITEVPQIAGTPQAEETLTASAMWTADPKPKAAWVWQRCLATGKECTKIVGSAGETYRVTTDDVGHVLRAHLKLTNAAGTVQARSAPTAVIAAAPGPPASPPPPPPMGTPAPPDLPGLPGPPGTAPPALLDPFPTVRIRGRLTPGGARVTRLSIEAPPGASIVASCHGSTCPAHKLARAAGIRLRRFERELRAGTRLEITVTKPGYVGKWTTIVIRRGTAPRRRDRCVYPGPRDRVPCPAA
jgi:hypothetical protein